MKKVRVNTENERFKRDFCKMKIVIFCENSQNGGLDTFIASLVNNWPNSSDSFIIVCNKSHPGSENLRNSINREFIFVENDAPLVWDLSRRLRKILPGFVIKVIWRFLRILIAPIQYIYISKTLGGIVGDKLLVVNGGYPGGDSCIIASIVWFNTGRGRSIHNFHNFSAPYSFGFGWYEKFLDSKLIKSTKTFVSVSKVCAASLNDRGDLWSEIDIKYIYNGISGCIQNQNNITNLRKDLKIGNSPLCLMLGTYEPRKGHEFIFKVFSRIVKKIPNACLIICGGGTNLEFKRVKRLRDEIVPHQNVILLDFVPNGANLISQSDLLLIGSQSFESFGYTAIEAMMRKIPVVSTNTGGLFEVIKNNDGGFIFDKEDFFGFSNKVLQLLSSKKLRTEVGLRGRERALSLFLSDRMSKEYFNLLND